MSFGIKIYSKNGLNDRFWAALRCQKGPNGHLAIWNGTFTVSRKKNEILWYTNTCDWDSWI